MMRFFQFRELKKTLFKSISYNKNTAAFFPLSLVKETRATVSIYCFFLVRLMNTALKFQIVTALKRMHTYTED